ncbi:MAG: RDD domain-containing protein [Parcubacteria group bacterium GW2011_GWA2_43_13]|nr:MAG: RDD domain-containing protein [Parcubacteria group bacterium GW2011_GWA2_43_13]OGY70210.1 MAG: hypothetical protein A2986_01985 [Candidatus Jacksonbacteria bacterium RIFCSPLOWO2_01_FULL_44_13]HAZ17012.1 hypothetical protein [Candidatus Jacksonbacteria bacterium]
MDQSLQQTAPDAGVLSMPSQLASRWSRLGATLLEECAIFFPIAIIGGLVSVTSSVEFENIGDNGIFLGVGFISFILFFVVNLMLMSRRGQSLGKHWLNIQVIDTVSGKKVSFGRYFWLREVVGRNIIAAIPFLGLLYVLIDSLFIFRKDRKTIHDLIGGTSVIVLQQEKLRKGFIDFTPLE